MSRVYEKEKGGMRHEEEEKNSCGWEEGEGGATSTAKLLAQAVNIFTQQVKALRILIQLGHKL
jgi:hypothetical protein